MAYTSTPPKNALGMVLKSQLPQYFGAEYRALSFSAYKLGPGDGSLLGIRLKSKHVHIGQLQLIPLVTVPEDYSQASVCQCFDRAEQHE